MFFSRLPSPQAHCLTLLWGCRLWCVTGPCRAREGAGEAPGACDEGSLKVVSTDTSTTADASSNPDVTYWLCDLAKV